MTIAVNLVRDPVRNRRRQFWKRTKRGTEAPELVERTLAGTAPSSEAQTPLNEQVKAAWAAAANLPEKQKMVFLLRFVEDMELLEIGAVTGLRRRHR